MAITNYHAKYYASELTRRGHSGVERISQSLFDASVDLNPHQIDAALFALRSPLSNGVLLADEVGLGKTIEAGLVLCQFWAERKRRLLVICPASLRKQWAMELSEKFNLPVYIMDAKGFRESENISELGSFDQPYIIITSIHFASRRSSEVRMLPWDLVVIDEAHKLRNAYRESNRMGQNIRAALEGTKKILLTATPLQNSLLEIYGLASVIDENIFGDLPSFRTQYVNTGGNIAELRERLSPFCQETCEKLFHCNGLVKDGVQENPSVAFRLEAEADRHVKATINQSLETNNRHYQEARDMLERWAEDAVLGSEKELKDTKEQIKALTRQARQAPTLEEQRQIQDRIRTLEKKKRRQRQTIFDVEDEIMEKRDKLITQLEERMSQKSEIEPLFTIRWRVI